MGEQGPAGLQGPVGEQGPVGKSTICLCTAQLKNLLPQLLGSYAGRIFSLNLESGSTVTDIPTGLYPTTDPGLLLFPGGKAVSLSRIAAIKIPGATYNDSIAYIPDLNLPQGDCEAALRAKLTQGSSVQLFTCGTDISGIVLKSACGIAVITDHDGRNLNFIPLCKVESIIV